jgi:hypothetical protein
MNQIYYTDFAAKIKQKYPGAYDNVPDLKLAEKVIEKYPVYASQVKMEKTPGDFFTESMTSRKETKANIEKDYGEGKIGLGQALFQSIGNVIGGAWDIAAAPVQAMLQPRKGSIINSTTAPMIQEGAGKTMEFLSKPLAEKLADPSVSTYQNASKVFQKAGDLRAQANKEADPTKKQYYNELADIQDKAGQSMMKIANDENWSLENAQRNVESTLNIGTLPLGANAKPAIAEGRALLSKTLTGAAERVAPYAEQVVAKGESLISKVTGKGARTVEDSLAEAQGILNPSGVYTAGEKEAAYQAGKVTVKGKGLLKKEVIAPQSTQQTAMIDELAQSGKVSSKNLPSQNINALQKEARIAESGIDDVVNRPEFNKPFNQNMLEKDVFKRIENSAKENLTFVSDSVEQKAYQEVMQLAREEIKKQAFNMSGLRTAIKNFNARMKKILGSDIYSESVGNARLQAAKDVRSGLNTFLADNLESPVITKSALAGENVGAKLPAKSTFDYGRQQAGSIYKAQLQREAMLLNAVDEISFRSRGMLNVNAWKKAIKQYPWLKPIGKLVLYGGGGAIAGSAVFGD